MLESIKNRQDLLALKPHEDAILCDEIRSFLLQHIAQTGGHLASNLGIVELTLALHKVYDTATDRLIFDVGHQAYVHKMLTGRMDGFDTLRKFGGLAGFPKPSESDHDAFIAGHASNSVSVALGMARARTLKGQSHHIVCVIGDGALTGGLAYEGLNDAGASGEPLVVVLNDNQMSIERNVGAIAKHLTRLRLKPGYFAWKNAYRQLMKKLPCGAAIYAATRAIKDRIKHKLLGVTVFEEMGFNYLGPVDGHDVKKLTFLLQQAKEMEEPVLLHVLTKKGKGFTPAENRPASFHGVGTFDPDTGISTKTNSVTFSDTFGKTLCRLAEEDATICAITAAMESGTGLHGFAIQFPERFFNVGIAEGHAVSMAAGLAKQGMTPVFAVYSTFLQRSYDMLLHDVALLGLHVVLSVDRAGLVGEDGETHHGVFDIGFLRQIPGMYVLCPASQAELQVMLLHAVREMTVPVAIRYPKGGDGRYVEQRWTRPLDPAADLTIVTYGTVVNDVLDAADLLHEENYHIDVVKIDQVCPLDMSQIVRSVKTTGRLIVVEETAQNGCVGREILTELSLLGIPCQSRLCNLGNGIVTHGTIAQLKALTGIDAMGIYQAAKELLHEK